MSDDLGHTIANSSKIIYEAYGGAGYDIVITTKFVVMASSNLQVGSELFVFFTDHLSLKRLFGCDFVTILIRVPS